jgi:hypothetical protein
MVNRLLTEIHAGVAGAHAYLLLLRLTLVMLMFYGASSTILQVPLLVAATTMLAFPALLTERWLWWILVAVITFGNGLSWYAIDNHKYLMTYWTLACALSLHASRRTIWLATTAQLLVGLVFAFAAAWKMIAGEYWDGSFLYFTSLTDSRLQRIGAAVSGHSMADLGAVGQALSFLGIRGIANVYIPVPVDSGLHLAAVWFSWAAVIGEAAIAVSFLIPVGELYRWRNYGLMMFVLFTYFLLPVTPFAIALILLGLAQCQIDDDKMKIRYLCLLMFIHLTLIPWSTLLPVA